MEGEELPCPSPSPFKPPPSSIFKDISNFKTPKRQSHISSLQSPCHQSFTASKRTPLASSTLRRPRPSLAPSSSAARSKASRKLKAFELEQSQSSRKVQVKKEQTLKSLANSLTVWLNFLFENPRACGCDWPVGDDGCSGGSRGKGKRDFNRRAAVGVDMAWRCPKRQRDLSWGSPSGDVAENEVEFSNSRYAKLRESLKDVCSLDDLTQRMRVYLSSNNCKDTLDIMAQVAKVRFQLYHFPLYFSLSFTWLLQIAIRGTLSPFQLDYFIPNLEIYSYCVLLSKWRRILLSYNLQ